MPNLSRNEKNRTDLEQMSTADLEKMLLEDFDSPDHREAGMASLYTAAQILAEREPRGRSAADRAWERFRENYLPFAEALVVDGTSPSTDGGAPGRDDRLHL